MFPSMKVVVDMSKEESGWFAYLEILLCILSFFREFPSVVKLFLLLHC